MLNHQIPFKQRLVAHRGNSDHFTENSLQGLQSALETGAHYLEADIQITKDNIVVLSHDASLKKITGKDILVSESSFDDIKDLPAGYADKFGQQYSNFKISTLEQVCTVIANYPQAHFFVEIKHECIASHGTRCLDLILPIIEPIKSQVILISFNDSILSYARKVCDLPIGWVWPNNEELTDSEHMDICHRLNPDFVFCDKDSLPLEHSAFWQGNWEKAIYTMANMDDYDHYKKMGFDLFETNNISEHYKAFGE